MIHVSRIPDPTKGQSLVELDFLPVQMVDIRIFQHITNHVELSSGWLNLWPNRTTSPTWKRLTVFGWIHIPNTTWHFTYISYEKYTIKGSRYLSLKQKTARRIHNLDLKLPAEPSSSGFMLGQKWIYQSATCLSFQPTKGRVFTKLTS